MRTAWLVTYDVSAPERLRRVYKVMRRFGDHLQLSVFRCILSERDLVRLKVELAEAIDQREDQVLFANLGPEDGRGADAMSALGRPYTHPERHAVVV